MLVRYSETTAALRHRYREAFRRYSRAHTRLRSLQARPPHRSESSAIHQVSSQMLLVASAERSYRAIRLEYIHRLLSAWETA